MSEKQLGQERQHEQDAPTEPQRREGERRQHFEQEQHVRERVRVVERVVRRDRMVMVQGFVELVGAEVHRAEHGDRNRQPPVVAPEDERARPHGEHQHVFFNAEQQLGEHQRDDALPAHER